MSFVPVFFVSFLIPQNRIDDDINIVLSNGMK